MKSTRLSNKIYNQSCFPSFLYKAGLRTLHELGPQIKRAISGNLEDMEEGVDEGEPADIDEPSHRVSLLTDLLHRAMLRPQVAQRVL